MSDFQIPVSLALDPRDHLPEFTAQALDRMWLHIPGFEARFFKTSIGLVAASPTGAEVAIGSLIGSHRGRPRLRLAQFRPESTSMSPEWVRARIAPHHSGYYLRTRYPSEAVSAAVHHYNDLVAREGAEAKFCKSLAEFQEWKRAAKDFAAWPAADDALLPEERRGPGAVEGAAK